MGLVDPVRSSLGVRVVIDRNHTRLGSTSVIQLSADRSLGTSIRPTSTGGIFKLISLPHRTNTLHGSCDGSVQHVPFRGSTHNQEFAEVKSPANN